MHINNDLINPDHFRLKAMDANPAVKWRRRGNDRRRDLDAAHAKAIEYVEKRTSGDRRFNYPMLKRMSKIIFPRGKDSYDF